MDKHLPQARKGGLLVHELDAETLVYDLKRHRAHSLNRSAALVWRHCDGRTTLDGMAELLQRQLSLPRDERIVHLALDRLAKAHLLSEPPIRTADPAAQSRRALLRRLGLTGGLALLLPVITSIGVPTPAYAASSCAGRPCGEGSDCCPEAINCSEDEFGVNRCTS